MECLVREGASRILTNILDLNKDEEELSLKSIVWTMLSGTDK